MLDKTVVFERAMIVSREAARRQCVIIHQSLYLTEPTFSPFSGKWYKMMAGTMDVPTPNHFWEHMRSTTVRNILGYLPAPVVDRHPEHTAKPIVTYISRQGAGRRLVATDHTLLVDSLRQLEAEGLCEVVVAMMERMTLKEQIELVSRSTVRLYTYLIADRSYRVLRS
jgi:hypothetical protein